MEKIERKKAKLQIVCKYQRVFNEKPGGIAMDQFFLPAVVSFASGQVLVIQFIAGVPEVAFPSFSDNARFLYHPVFLFISVTKQDYPEIRVLTQGL